MSWVDELGEKKLTDKDIKTFIKVMELVITLDDDTDEDDFKESFTEVIDTAVHNLNKFKKALGDM